MHSSCRLEISGLPVYDRDSVHNSLGKWRVYTFKDTNKILKLSETLRVRFNYVLARVTLLLHFDVQIMAIEDSCHRAELQTMYV